MTSITSDVVKTILPMNTIKVVFNTIFILLFIIGAGVVWYYHKDNAKLKESNVELTNSNALLKRDLELVKIGQASMVAGQLLASTQKEELTKKAQNVNTNLKIKEQVIDRSDLTVAEKEQKKSAARMDSVWEMYCQVQPENTICKQGGYQ